MTIEVTEVYTKMMVTKYNMNCNWLIQGSDDSLYHCDTLCPKSPIARGLVASLPVRIPGLVIGAMRHTIWID